VAVVGAIASAYAPGDLVPHQLIDTPADAEHVL
jgi:hypothetical protein